MANKRTKTDFIVIHTAATRPFMDVGANDIRQWHLAEGYKDIGYHYVIRRNGTVETGRPEDAVGSHVKGYNTRSIGICLVGGLAQKAPYAPENNYTKEQFKSLTFLLKQLKMKYPKAEIKGHRDFPGVVKACPCFDVKAWLKTVSI